MQMRGNLTTPRRLLLAVGAAYVLAWCLPSLRFDVMGVVVMRGWDVTWQALTPFLKAGMETNELLLRLTSIASALTNVVFVVAFVYAWRWTSSVRLATASGERRPFRWAIWVLISSAALNLFWFVISPGRGSLKEGYYLWVLSFVALAGVLAWVRRSTAVASPRDRVRAAG